MKISFDNNASATYSGFKEITPPPPPPDPKRQEILDRIRSAEERITKYKDADTPFKQRNLAYAKHDLEESKLDLALHDEGLNERKAASEAYFIDGAIQHIRELKSVTALEYVGKALIAAAIKAASNK